MATITLVKQERATGSNTAEYAGIAIASLVYFSDVFIRASQKCFWFDELFTVYLCRLPTFADTWKAIGQGADFNPPLLYWLTRGSQRLFGDGLIATRLPATVGVWLFCLCIFLFVAKRAGAIPGFIAGAFPLFTLVQYYAYEARAHGIVLGWTGLALLCWQRSIDKRARLFWLVGFFISLLAALLTHLYAVYILVPFGAAEVYSLFKRQQVRWSIVGILLAVPGYVIPAVYLPLLRAYRTSITVANYFPASHDALQRFLVGAMGPAVVVLLLWLGLSAIGSSQPAPLQQAQPAILMQEKIIAVVLACIPLLGLIGSKVSHGPFLNRYFLSSVAGFAILFGFAVSVKQGGATVAKWLAAIMALLMLADLGSTAYLGSRHRLMLTEPSSGLRLTTTPNAPMALYDSLSKDTSGLDVLVLPSLDYVYFFHYAPPAIIHRMYFGATEDGVIRGGYDRLISAAHVGLQMTDVQEFTATRPRFLVYESLSSAHTAELQTLFNAGYRPVSVREDVSGVMYEYEK